MKRAAVAAAGAAAAQAGEKKLFNVALEDGSAVLGPRPDTSSIRDDESWRVKEVPKCFDKFHDVICGAWEQNVLFLSFSLFVCRATNPFFCRIIFDQSNIYDDD